jgi:hypothetical protein
MMGTTLLERAAPKEDATISRHILSVRTSCTRLLDQINALLDIRRMQEGRMPLSTAAVSVRSLLETCREDYAPAAEYIGLGLTFCKLAAEAHGGDIEIESPWDGDSGVKVRILLGRAPEQQPAEILVAHRRVELSLDEGENWVAVKAGDPVPVGGVLRTAPDARAEVKLADGSIIQIKQSSQLAIVEFQHDRRNGKRNSRLRVVLGSILGRIEPETVEASEFKIDTGEASVAIRGTGLQVNTEGKTSRLSVYDGRTAMEAGGKQVDVPEHFGTLSKGGRPPESPVKLLDPPTDLTPAAALHRTANQQPVFSWKPLRSRRAGTYRLEIAQDLAFNLLVQDHVAEQPPIQAGILSDGTYYWRMSAIDKDGLEGDTSHPRQIDITRNLVVAINATRPLLAHKGNLLAVPAVRYRIEPDRGDTSAVQLTCTVNGESVDIVKPGIALTEDGDYVITAQGIDAEGNPGTAVTLEVRVGHPAGGEGLVGRPAGESGTRPPLPGYDSGIRCQRGCQDRIQRRREDIPGIHPVHPLETAG